MNINIGNDRWVKFTRSTTRTGDGEWRGRGFGLRFRVSRVSNRWSCTVWRDGGAVLATCEFIKMKSSIQEGARLADVATGIPCPT